MNWNNLALQSIFLSAWVVFSLRQVSCIYFGGEVIDMVPSAIVAAFIFYLDNYFKKDYMNQVLYMVLCSMLAGMLTIY